jgi:hypothetical protein
VGEFGGVGGYLVGLWGSERSPQTHHRHTTDPMWYVNIDEKETKREVLPLPTHPAGVRVVLSPPVASGTDLKSVVSVEDTENTKY